jgi:hypothetical protein
MSIGIIEKDGTLCFEGGFDLGVLGKYSAAQISFDEDMLEFIRNPASYEEYKNEYDTLYKERYARMDHIFLSGVSEQEKINMLAEFYNGKQQEVFENKKGFEDQLWCLFTEEIYSPHFPFWGDDPDGPFEPFIIETLMPKGDFEDNEELGEAVYKAYRNADRNLDGPGRMQKYFPMIDTQKLADTIYAEYLTMEGDL